MSDPTLLKKIVKQLNKLNLSDDQQRFRSQLELKMHTTGKLDAHELNILRGWNQGWQSEKLSKYISISSPQVNKRKIDQDAQIDDKIKVIESEIVHQSYKLERSRSMEMKKQWSEKLGKTKAELNRLESRKEFLLRSSRGSEADLNAIVDEEQDLTELTRRRDILVEKLRKIEHFLQDVHSDNVRSRAEQLREKLKMMLQDTANKHQNDETHTS